MTREEAINVMQKYTDTDSGISKVVAEAHEMAIKALEQEPCEVSAETWGEISGAWTVRFAPNEPCETSTDEPITMIYPTIFCEDTISRQDAIEAVKQAIYNHDSAIMRLTELPSVTPRRKGYWIKVGGMSYVNDKYQCSECGEIITEMPVCMTEPLYKGCPYCLAEMESEE